MKEAWLVRAGHRLDRWLRLDGQPFAQRANRMVQRYRARFW